jgi:hypothetical protein
MSEVDSGRADAIEKRKAMMEARTQCCEPDR